MASPAGAAPPETLAFAVHLGGIRIGESRSITEIDPGAGTFVRSEILSVSLQRGGQSLSLRQSSTSREDSDGQLLELAATTEGMGPRAWLDRIRKIDSGWERTRDRGDGPRTDTLAASLMAGPIGVERRLAGGIDSLDFAGPDEATLEAHRYTVRAIADGASPSGGSSAVRAYEVIDLQTGLTSREGRDAGGRLVWAEDPMLGWRLERIDGGRDAASPPTSSSGPPALDLFEWRPIPFRGVSPVSGACVLRVVTADDPKGEISSRFPIPEGPGQAVERGDRPASMIVRIAPPLAVSASATQEEREAWGRDPELAPFLASSITVDGDHPEVRAFADQACKNLRGPVEEAVRLEKAVHDRIQEDDLQTAFATASQTLVARSGDCTEHAVLLAACLRARGIPARLVAGLVPTYGKMLYHLWTEAYLGRWVPLDATIGRGRSVPCALALARWAQPEEGLADFYVTMSRLGGQIEVEVVGP